MRFFIYFLLPSLLLLFASGCEKKSTLPEPDPLNGGITLPDGFGAIVFADSIGPARHLAVNDNGDVYVHLREWTNGGAIKGLRDTNGDGRADEFASFSAVNGTGIEIHNGSLYFSNTTRLLRMPLNAGQLLPDTTKVDTLVRLLGGDEGHVDKPFTFDKKGFVYVNVGSYSNCCEQPYRTGNSPGADPCVELETRAGIWRFKDDQPNQEQTLALRYASGNRNAMGIDWNQATDKLYTMQHGRDDLHRYWPDKFTVEENVELPAEEFFEVEAGDFLGWPYCYYNPFTQQKLLNPEYGGDGKMTGRCDSAKKPLMGFPGHWAPNDLMFYTGSLFPERYKNGAFIAFHGSWNRLENNQAGYLVAFVPMKDGQPTGPYEVFASGFAGPDPVLSPGDAAYRPCGLAQGPDGSIYVVDSQKGRVWRIFYYPKG